MLAQETPFFWPAGNGTLTGYRLPGTHPGGVFLHGFRSNCDGEKARALARQAALRGRSWLRFNQRYSAAAEQQFAHFTLTQAIEDTVAVVDLFRQPSVLVGSSLGAVIALETARYRPDAVSGLLLLAPAVRFVARHFASLPAADVADWRARGTRRFPDLYEGGFFQLDYGFYRDALGYIRPGPWKFDCPVTILHGDKDELLPAQDSIELKQDIQAPSVFLEIIAGGDHRLSQAIPVMCRALDTLWTMH